MTADLNPVLLDAKNMYVIQLAEAVGPHILDTIADMYEKTVEEGSSDVLYRFQQKLREIPTWNSVVVEEHTKAIEVKTPFLDTLISCACVAFVKVLSSIRLNDEKPNIRLKLPNNTSFVHKAFINVARDFYANPRLGAAILVYQGLLTAVEKTVRSVLPMHDILRAYLGGTVDDAHTVSPVLEDDDDDDASPGGMFDASPASPTSPAPPVPLPCAPPVPVAPPQHDAFPPAAHPPAPPQHDAFASPPPVAAPVVTVTDCETKTISIPRAAPADDLFSDADDGEADWAHK